MLSPFSALPQRSAAVILADPAWTFKTYSKRGEGRTPQHHYDTMTIDDIKALPVEDLAAPDCWLFMWVTGPHLRLGFDVIEAWGFRYSGIGFSWAKTTKDGKGWAIGPGYTTRKNIELCLLASRGKPKRKSAAVRELIVAPRREHSRKPEECRERIEQFASGPYVDLFSRESRPGWTCWGNDSGKFDSERVAC